MGFGTSVESAKAMFFDRKGVAGQLDPAVKKALSKFGAFVRTRARTSVRSRKKVSEPGAPPSSHTGTLKKLIFFSFDPAKKSVVIGPALGGSESGAPGRLEKGGTAFVRPLERMTRTAGRIAHYRPRPYMRPAFKAELGSAAERFKDIIRP